MSLLATCLSLKGHPLIEMKEVQLPRNTPSPSEIKTFRCSVKQLLLHCWTWLTSGLLMDWPLDSLKTRKKKDNCSIKMHMATDWAKILFTSRHSYMKYSDTNKLLFVYIFSLTTFQTIIWTWTIIQHCKMEQRFQFLLGRLCLWHR